MDARSRRRTRGGHQLPPGPHGLSRAFVARNQRDRILVAVANATSEAGYSHTSVEEIIARAGVSRRTFYAMFENKQAAFLAAYDEAVKRLFGGIREAQTGERGFAEWVVAGLGAFLAALSQSPAFARMCIVEVLAAGPEAVRRRNDAIEQFAVLLEQQGAIAAPDRALPPLAAEIIVGGICETVYRRLADGRIDELEGLLPDLVQAALLPYLGEEATAAARRRLEGSSGRGPAKPHGTRRVQAGFVANVRDLHE